MSSLVYQERPPDPALAPWVEGLWAIRGRVDPGAETLRSVVPDGCMDVIFDLAAPGTAGGAAHMAVGTMTRPLPVASRGAVHLVGVRFRPGGARAFLDAPAHELVDRRAPLDALWGPAAGETWERLAGGEERALETLLLARLRGGLSARDDGVVRAALGLLDGGSPPGSATLSRQLGLGLRQLERRFRDAVGVGPGTLARILRFRRAAELIRRRRGRGSLARVALEAGYHDQPHMNRDFRAFAGETPGELRARGAGLTLPRNDAPVQDPPRPFR